MQVKIEDLVTPKFMPGDTVFIRKDRNSEMLHRATVDRIECKIVINKDGRHMSVGYVIKSETWWDFQLFSTPNEAFGLEETA